MSGEGGYCRECRYSDPNETSGYKWYCEWYKTYEDPDRYQDDCKHFEEK